MPDYEGFPPDEVEALKSVCIDARFAEPSAIVGTRRFARIIMRAGWRRRPQWRLRERGRGGARPGGEVWVGGELELLDDAGRATFTVRVPAMPEDDWERLVAALGGRPWNGMRTAPPAGEG